MKVQDKRQRFRLDKVSVSYTYGLDKATMEERLEWVSIPAS